MVKISIKDYRCYITPLIDACEKKNCREYWRVTTGRLQNKMENPEEYKILTLFDKIFSYTLMSDSPNEPFKPSIILRCPIPDDISPEEREFLQRVLPKITDSELKARVADTLWTLRHGKPHEHAQTAIEAYLIVANTISEEYWLDTKDRLVRALCIFNSLGLSKKKPSKKMDVPKRILEYIEDNATPPYLVVHLIDTLYLARSAYNAKHVKILKCIATNYETCQSYNAAKDAWDLAADLYNRGNMTDEAIQCKVKAAETYVTQADIMEAMQPPSYLQICHFLQSAVTAYRFIPSKRERYDVIYARWMQAQPKVQDEMQVASVDFDASNFMKDAVKKVSGYDVFTALYKFSFIYQPPCFDEMKKQMLDLEQQSPLLAIVSGQHLDHKGRVISISSIDDKINVKVHRHIAQFHRQFLSKSTLIPALQQIRLEHNISLFEWKSLIKNNPFIPPERINAYAYGLFHGFHGDFFSASHILIPQIENSIRYVLNNYERQTSKQIMGGTQEERSLNQILECKELEDIFGKDLVFDLQGLLIKKEGANMRNNLMHGFLDDYQLFSPEIVYVYWLTLHIIFIPFRNSLATTRPQSLKNLHFF